MEKAHIVPRSKLMYKVKEDKGLTASIEESEGFIEPNAAKIIKISFKLD